MLAAGYTPSNLQSDDLRSVRLSIAAAFQFPEMEVKRSILRMPSVTNPPVRCHLLFSLGFVLGKCTRLCDSHFVGAGIGTPNPTRQ